MGTNQQLTTEQLELLILLNEINVFKENLDEELETGVKESITSDNYMSVEKFEEMAEVLEHYGYIHDIYDYEPTIDGVQYLRLFKEHLEVQENKPTIVINNQFSLVNTVNLRLGLFNSMFGSSLESELLKGIIKVVKKLVSK